MARTASVTFTPEALIGKVDEIEKFLLPRAANSALHKAVFETSRELSHWAQIKFESTVPFTLKSFLYKKPTPVGGGIEASVFIRDDAPKGNPPSRYLAPQIAGGRVYRTRFQQRLEQKGVLGGMQDDYMMPALQTIGRRRLSPGEYTKALWGIKAFEDFRMPTNKGMGYKTLGSYIWVPPNAAFQIGLEAHANKIRGLNKGKLPKAGIYKVLKRSLKQKFISLDYFPSYTPKFNFENLAKTSVEKVFTSELLRNLKRI